jgi:hypothetical protein
MFLAAGESYGQAAGPTDHTFDANGDKHDVQPIVYHVYG